MESGGQNSSGRSSSGPKSGQSEPSKSAPTKVAGAMAAILHQSKTRRRKGSLRKTALLGPGKASQPVIHNTPPSPASPVRYDRPPYGSSSPSSSNESLTIRSPPKPPVNSSTLIIDRELLPNSDSHTSLAPAASNPSTLVAERDSYFPPLSPRHLRPPAPRPSKTANRSPLASLPPSFPLPTPSEHSYAETAYWGWFILFVTWIIFVVGMGSCFEVWSWAWDVGETPYAPPELEDDPTLPIVGYYPCLIILTGVMAWVWVVVAWVGMKYFKHAKMSGDEG
ncbi:hypothetical protein G7Y79_00063g093690 [Physcia stellaris]|nr:hypothetical protein G7Y79_00063g093690 [Physcia stellaris]